jgi:hypothetical protein
MLFLLLHLNGLWTRRSGYLSINVLLSLIRHHLPIKKPTLRLKVSPSLWLTTSDLQNSDAAIAVAMNHMARPEIHHTGWTDIQTRDSFF